MSSNRAINKMLAIVLILAVIIASVAAAYYYYSTMTVTPTVAKEVTIMNISYQDDWYKARVDEFNAAHNGSIHVTLQPLADYYTQIVTTLTTAPNTVDIVRTNPGYMAPWAEAGWITTLDDLSGYSDYLSKVEPSRRPELEYNNSHYGLPAQTGYTAIFLYNKRILEQAGFDHPPATLEELVSQSQAIKNQGILQYPLAWHLKGSERRIDWAWYEFTLMKGGMGLYDENWNATYLDAGSPGYEGLKFIVDAIHQYQIMDPADMEWDTFKVVDLLMKGQAAFVPSDPFQWATINSATYQEAGNISQALMPSSHYTWVKSDQMSITKAARDKGQDFLQAAWEVLKWFAGPEKDQITYHHVLDGLTLYSCYTPINNDPEVKQLWSTQYNTTTMAQQIQYSVSLQDFSPAHKTTFYLSWVNDYLIPNLQAAILQTKPIGTALAAIDSGFQSLADEHGLPPR